MGKFLGSAGGIDFPYRLREPEGIAPSEQGGILCGMAQPFLRDVRRRKSGFSSQLSQEILDVFPNRFWSAIKYGANLDIAFALGDPENDLTFALSETNFPQAIIV